MSGNSDAGPQASDHAAVLRITAVRRWFVVFRCGRRRVRIMTLFQWESMTHARGHDELCAQFRPGLYETTWPSYGPADLAASRKGALSTVMVAETFAADSGM